MNQTNLPPPSYFSKVKSVADWNAANLCDNIPVEWQQHFPQTAYEHKIMRKIYKQQMRRNK